MASSADMESTSEKRAFTEDCSHPIKKRKIVILKTSPQKVPTPNSAANRCLQVAELLENILITVDFKTLLFAQRTSNAFRNTVTGSPKLQKKLFMKPVDSFEEVKTLHMLENDSIVLVTKSKAGTGMEDGTQMLSLLNSAILGPQRRTPGGVRWSDTHDFPLSAGIYGELKAHTRNKSSSWRTMYMSQPLPEVIRLEVSIDAQILRFSHGWRGPLGYFAHSGSDVLPKMIRSALVEYPGVRVRDCVFEVNLDLLRLWGEFTSLEIKRGIEIMELEEDETTGQ